MDLVFKKTYAMLPGQFMFNSCLFISLSLTHTHTDTHTDTHRYTHRHRHRQTHTQTHRHTHRHRHRHTHTHTHTHTHWETSPEASLRCRVCPHSDGTSRLPVSLGLVCLTDPGGCESGPEVRRGRASVPLPREPCGQLPPSR